MKYFIGSYRKMRRHRRARFAFFIIIPPWRNETNQKFKQIPNGARQWRRSYWNTFQPLNRALFDFFFQNHTNHRTERDVNKHDKINAKTFL